MTWRLHPGNKLLTHYRDAWQTLNARCYASHPLLDVEFVAPLYEHFGSADVHLMVREEATGDIGGLALIERAGPGCWRLFMPSQTNMGPLLIDDRCSAARACEHMDSLLSSLPGFAWQIGLTRQDPLYSRLADNAHQPKLERIPDWTTTYIDVDESFDHFWQTRTKKLRQDVRRIFRRLEAGGIHWRLEVLCDREVMTAGVREYGEMESAGWKGAEGTAVRHDNIQGEFYTRVLENFARVDDARIYQLYLNDKLAASLLTISRNHMLVVLKTTYEESLASLAPGRLIDYLMLERTFADARIDRIENYTNASTEDARWCSGTRNLCHVNYYRFDAMRCMVQIRRRWQTMRRERIQMAHGSEKAPAAIIKNDKSRSGGEGTVCQSRTR